MCTLSWLRNPQGLDLMVNRDERRSRVPAAPPTVRTIESTRVIAPTDGAAGGSWIAANERGLVVTLLNGYSLKDRAERGPGGEWVSRGHLVLELASVGSVEAVRQRLDSADFSPYRSFYLIAFDPSDGLLASWHEGTKEVRDETRFDSPLISSSYRFPEVRESRRAYYRDLIGATEPPPVEAALEFHRSHHPERGPFSPCMHRDDARTVSFTWVRVDASSVSMRYSPDAPCRHWPPDAPLTLERSAVSV